MNSSDPSSYRLDSLPILEAGFSGSLTNILIILFLLAITAIIAGSESAFFSLKPAELDDLKKENSKKSKQILELLSRPKDILATLLITLNFVNIGIVILTTVELEKMFEAWHLSETARFLIEVVGITLLILITGEVIPKIFASNNAAKVVRWMSGPMKILSKTPPVSWLRVSLVGVTYFFQKAFKPSVNVNTYELEQALALTREESTSEEDHKILEGIVKFGKTEACQIMTPRIEVDAIDKESNFKEVIDFILEAGYSRIPVFENSQDNVIGLLYIKDLLPHLNENEVFDWHPKIRKCYFIPENKKINDLLQDFRKMKMHLAIVVDEYGGASGIVTLEDILEEIVGDITDEFDDLEIVYTKIDASTYLFEGRTSLNDMYKVLDCDPALFEQLKGEAETIGGFVTEQAGRILKNNEFIEVGNCKLIVESSDKRRVKTVKIKFSASHD